MNSSALSVRSTGEVVALLRRARRVDRMAVIDKLRIPLAGLRAEEPVEALEAPARRPVAPGRRDVHLGLRAQMPLADHVRVPAALGEDLLDLAVLRRDPPPAFGKPLAASVMQAMLLRVWLRRSAGTTRRRAQRRRVPLRVAHTPAGDPVDVRRSTGRRSTPSPRTRRRPGPHRRRSARPRAPSAARTATSPAPSRGCRR